MGNTTKHEDYYMSSSHHLINCWCVIMSALFRQILILSSWDRIASIAFLNSSEMSSLWASNSRMMRSARSANLPKSHK